MPNFSLAEGLTHPEILASVLPAEILPCAGITSADNTAIMGKNDWIFLYEGTNRYYEGYSEKEKIAEAKADAWCIYFDLMRHLFQQSCLRFNFLIIPNKASVLSSFYPLKLYNDMTPRLEKVLQKQGDMLICPLKVFREQFYDALFRKNDTHLTGYGNLRLLKIIMEAFSLDPAYLQLPVEYKDLLHPGDLGKRFPRPIYERVRPLKVQEYTGTYKEICIPNTVNTGLMYETFNPDALYPVSLLVFGNSFIDRPPGWGLAPFLSACFSRFRFYWSALVTPDVIKDFKPDFILFQTCERFLNTCPTDKPPTGAVTVNRHIKEKKVMKLALNQKGMLHFDTTSKNSFSLYSGEMPIGKIEGPQSEFPYHSLITNLDTVLKYGLVAHDEKNDQFLNIDLEEFKEEYIRTNLIKKLQNAIDPGKWVLLSIYVRKNSIEANFEMVLPANELDAEPVFTCNGSLPVEKYFFKPHYFATSHWFMPKSALFSCRCFFDLKTIPPFATFDVNLYRYGKCLTISKYYRKLSAVTEIGSLTHFPDITRIQRVAGKQANIISFANGGRSAFLTIKKIIEKYGFYVETDSLSLLDWGVGCGRVIRYFAEYPLCTVCGIDIDTDAVGWCFEHLKGTYLTVDMMPPTSLESESFDIIYSCSVLSHLTEDVAMEWLGEMARLLKPNGIGLLSFNGLSTSASYLSWRPKEFIHILQNNLFCRDINHDLDGFIQDTKYYRASFAQDAWWEKQFRTFFDLVDIELSAVSGFQHFAVVQKSRENKLKIINTKEYPDSSK